MSIKQQIEVVNTWKQNPLIRHYSFTDKRLWGKQEEVLWAYRRHSKVVVKSGNTIGKSFLAADIGMDWLTINKPARVITTAPTFSQVEGIIWREIRNYYNSSKMPIGGQLLQTSIHLGDDWFGEGISTNEVARFQGRHNPHLLVIIDEASGVPSEIWEAVYSLHPEKIVALGNPLEVSGDFFDAFSSPLWHKVSISCLECVEWQKKNGPIPGLVTPEWIVERAQDWGVNSQEYKIHVLGEFPEETPDSLIKRTWVERARKGLDEQGKVLDDEYPDDELRIVSCDVATKHGDNETVILYRFGHTFKNLRAYRHLPVDATADKVSLESLEQRASSVVVDSDGVGEGLSDMLIAKHVPVLEFHGGYGAKAMDSTRFRNLRSQFYWVAAKKLEKGYYNLKHLPEREYEILKNQLCSIKVKPPDALGRIQIETKEDMAARGVKSPDMADAFIMSEFGFFMGKSADVVMYKYR